jgi:hypothetical protein
MFQTQSSKVFKFLTSLSSLSCLRSLRCTQMINIWSMKKVIYNILLLAKLTKMFEVFEAP